LADLHEKETRDGLWDAHLDGKAKESKKQFESWAARKSTWAYAELRAYLEYVSDENLDPLSINGSFAGALGISQFIPSSVQQYAKDGNEDGRVNLFHHEDAIESIGNYLKQHGWHKSVSRNEAFQIILKYNNSKYYARTILKVAELVEERRKALRASRRTRLTGESFKAVF
jgi:membrane-bound lytic murein transglycosylase B